MIELYEDISEEKKTELIGKVAEKIVRYGMGVPAIFFLEMHKPLNFLASQSMVVLEPFVRLIFDTADYMRFALIMERRENVERLIQEIERLEYERKRREKEEKSRRKEEKRKAREAKQENRWSAGSAASSGTD